MSASDALAAIQFIHTVVSKVKDNRDELKSVSNRLQFIVQSLEENRQRDVIRDAEYEDSLSAVFELITRTERVSRRMLKRSLGDRTWNAGEITNDLRHLNEDAQTFLSVHTVDIPFRSTMVYADILPQIKTLDLVQAAQSQQQAYLISSVEEIIAKIAEIDLALSRSKPAPELAAPVPEIGNSLLPAGSPSDVPVSSDWRSGQNTLQLPAGSPKGFEGSSALRGRLIGGAAGVHPLRAQILLSSDDAGSSDRPRGTEDEAVSVGVEPEVLVDKLRSSNHFALTVSGLHKSGEQYGPGSLEATFNDIPGAATIDQIKSIIEKRGYQCPEGLVEERIMFIKVTDGDSAFDAMAPDGLKISKDEPLMWWMNRYDEYHGIIAPTPMKTEVEWTRDSLKVDELTIRCHRTLRVPDGEEVSELPPDMGTFPIFPIAQIGSRVPEDMKKRGGFIMPMFRRESLWISFESGPTGRFPGPAVKVSVGGVNVVSGMSALDTSPLRNGAQDYIPAGVQPWIDGIVTGPGIVRQFVVTDMHKGYTVEEQVTGEAKVGGLQFDIYPRRPMPPGDFYGTKTSPEAGTTLVADETGRRYHTLAATPAELQLEHQTIAYARWIQDKDTASRDIISTPAAPWVLSQYSRRLGANPRLKARYPDPPVSAGPPAKLGRLCGASDPASWPRPAPPSLGIAAGGRIKQKIYRDKASVRVYNEQVGRRVHVHIVTPEYWEDLTGILPPFTPITRDLYASLGIPWFKLFDDYVDSITETSEALASVLSVSELDKLHSASAVKSQGPAVDVVDPDAPPRCFQHSLAVSSCVFRPCGHAVCSQCLGQALLCGSKCSCGSVISKFVGMQQPLPQVNIGAHENSADDDGMKHWNVQEIEQLSAHAVRHGKVVVIHLPEDNVAPLQQRDPISPTRPYWDPIVDWCP
ncbi:hypothetical protein NMY22_g2313 [Coprinellus aureogranulatus]|nr:hypothetical protein NMY22_g2313 [Coprinellus aureogranulatus]